MEKVVCNTRVLNANLTGVQRYTKSILDYFPKDEIELISPPIKYSRGIKGHLWDQLFLTGKVKNRLLWSPNNTGPMYYKRQVLSLHDLVQWDYPELLNNMYGTWYRYLVPILCKNAAHIITVSEFSKQRILELFKVPEDKITVIYNGINKPFPIIEANSKFNVPFKRYILSLGSIEPRKNISLLLTAWKNIINKMPDDLGLVIVGSKGNTRVFKNADIDENTDRVYFTGHINDDYVNQLYSNALFFVYLSFYEGFGLPPLEAMSHGITVLTGNRTSLPEVVGAAGVMIDPFSLGECETALIDLITNDDKRNGFREKAIVRSTMFTWEDSAKKTWDLLRQF